MEIALTKLNACDEIKIRTTFSNYSFRLIDPAQRRGELWGGLLGKERLSSKQY